MTREIRPPTEDERREAGEVMRVSLNFSRSFVEDRSSIFPIDDMRCVFDEGRMIATSGERRFTQWFAGRELAMSGIWGVATLPEHRGTGAASAAVIELLRGARQRGDPLTALYPAVLQPYRRLGYEIAGSFVTHEIALDDLPRADAAAVGIEPYDPSRDLEDIRARYRRAMSVHSGPIDSDDPWWWSQRILGNRDPDEIHQVVVARRAGGVEGYASFVYESHAGFLDISFRLACKHLLATTPGAYAALLSYARGFRGVGQAIRFTAPPDDVLALSVEVQRLAIESNYRWMLRLLDVPSALEQRGAPRVSGEATIEVDDPIFEENRGPWRIVADEGTVKVEPAERASGRAVSMRALSAMYTGFVSPHDAARAGMIDADDPAMPFLASLFAGPAPFMLDFF